MNMLYYKPNFNIYQVYQKSPKYHENKDDILHHIIEKGLQTLKADIENAVNYNGDFVERYKAICMAMIKYQKDTDYF